jgi:flagellar motility protein MotE (MotC chaperone)
MAAGNEKNRKSRVLLSILVVLAIFVLVPGVILGSLYLLSEDFQMTANQMLSGAPGAVGEYFSSKPTEEELGEQIKEISLYMLDIERQRAVDKLTLLRSEDERTYERVVRSMLRINPNSTRVILEEIRQQSLADNVIMSTLDQIEQERKEDLQKQADYLKSLSLQTAVTEMQKMIDSSINGHMYLANTLDYLEVTTVARLIEQLEEEDRDQVLRYFSDAKYDQILTAMANRQNRLRELQNQADIYRSQPPAALVEILGNTDTYELSDLAVIYTELGPLKAGQILSALEDDPFVFSLLNTIKENELMEGREETLTEDIRKALKIYDEYDDNVRELADIYRNMNNAAVANNLKRMIRNSAAPSVYSLGSGDTITITDEMIALDILRQFDTRTIGSILSTYDDTLASEITRMLAVPSEE